MSKLNLAMQKSGRLTEKTLGIFKQAGIDFDIKKNALFASSTNFPLELMLVRDDDIPEYVLDGTCDLGVVGRNVLEEKVNQNGRFNDAIEILKELDFGQCRLSLAIDSKLKYEGPSYFNGKKVATSYPNILNRYFQKNEIRADVIKISGSVEITPKLGVADAICDIVSTGGTLKANGLKEVLTILESQSVLIQTPVNLTAEKKQILERLLQRIEGVMMAQKNKYIMMNADRSSIDDIKKLLPGADEPSVMPLAGSGDKVAVHLVCREDIFWETMENLKKVGASSILVLPIEKYLV